jgi:hypothetical protein
MRNNKFSFFLVNIGNCLVYQRIIVVVVVFVYNLNSFDKQLESTFGSFNLMKRKIKISYLCTFTYFI